MLDTLQTMSHYALAQWAARYLAEQVYGLKSSHTLEAKARDLADFVRWYVAAKGHGEVEQWEVNDTQMYLAGLKQLQRTDATRQRVLATLRKFAHFIHEQPGSIFRKFGLPTRDLAIRITTPFKVSPLSEEEIKIILTAVDTKVVEDKRKNSRPRRNRAMLYVLLSGLRVSELLTLELRQLQAQQLSHVQRKGHKRKQHILLTEECRTAIDDYLHFERIIDDPQQQLKPLFLAGAKNKMLTRQQIGKILTAIAKDAGTQNISPSRLRHTLGFTLQKKIGSEAVTAAILGHVGTQYMVRYKTG